MIQSFIALLFSIVALSTTTFCQAFTTVPLFGTKRAHNLYYPISKIQSSENESEKDLSNLDTFLKTNFANFYSIIAKNEDFWKVLQEDGDIDNPTEFRFTIFAPSNQAMASSLTSKEQEQLKDPRNKETVDKLGLFHVISNEVVTADALFASAGIITAGGEVPVGRSTSGGLFGIGGKEDGGVTINGAKVTQTYEVGNGLVHEVDALISPRVLWRYMDQLRIPGSN